MRSNVAMRMAHLDQISPEIITKIAGVIGSKLKALGEVSREAYGGVSAVAEMCNAWIPTPARRFLTPSKRPTRAGRKHSTLMFVFDDILLLNSNEVKEVLAKVDRKILRRP